MMYIGNCKMQEQIKELLFIGGGDGGKGYSGGAGRIDPLQSSELHLLGP